MTKADTHAGLPAYRTRSSGQQTLACWPSVLSLLSGSVMQVWRVSHRTLTQYVNSLNRSNRHTLPSRVCGHLATGYKLLLRLAILISEGRVQNLRWLEDCSQEPSRMEPVFIRRLARPVRRLILMSESLKRALIRSGVTERVLTQESCTCTNSRAS